jgi:hypothetical protein
LKKTRRSNERTVVSGFLVSWKACTSKQKKKTEKQKRSFTIFQTKSKETQKIKNGENLQKKRKADFFLI